MAQSAVILDRWPANMFIKLREILLTQYIGSILVALLVLQAVVEVISTVVRTGFWVFRHHTESVLRPASDTSFPWETLVYSAVTIALYMLTAYGLMQWLYPPILPAAQKNAEDDSATDQPERS